MDFIEQMNTHKKSKIYVKKIKHINSNKQMSRWKSSEKIDEKLRRSIPMFSKGGMDPGKIEEDEEEDTDEFDFSDGK